MAPSFQPLVAYMEDLQESLSASAAATLVLQDGRVLVEWYGGRPAQPGARYNVASVRKTYLGLALALAIHEGRVDGLDDPVHRYLPDPQGLLSGTTLRHLVTHTHGLVQQDGLFRRAFAPGSGWQYNNVGIDLLCRVIAGVTGQTPAALITARVLLPAGLQETGWCSQPSGELIPDVFDPAEPPRLRLGLPDGTDSNLYVSPRDLLRWGELHLNRGRIGGEQILPADLFEQTTRVQSPALVDPDLPQNGFCWWVKGRDAGLSEIGADVPVGSYQALGINGCACLVVPELNAVAVRMLNKIGNPPGYDYLQDIRTFGNIVCRLLSR